MEQGRWREAAEAFELAVQYEPSNELAWLNLGNARRHEGQLQTALDAARQAMRLQPKSRIAHDLAVTILFALNRWGDALQQLLNLHPDLPRDKDYYADLGAAYLKLHRPAEAIAPLLASIQQELHFATAHFRLGMAFRDLAMHREASESFRTTWLLVPSHTQALEHACAQAMYACFWDHLDEDVAQLERIYEQGGIQHTSPFSLLSLPVGPQTQKRSAVAAMHTALSAIAPMPPVVVTVDSPPSRALKVGYVSADWGHHATSMLIAQVLESRDPSKTEVSLYSTSRSQEQGVWRERMQKACDHFVDLEGQSDLEAAQRIRADGIDILVDLKGLTSDHRPGIFAHRPAPIQVAYLGYPGTCGMQCIDYIIGDAVVTPLSARDDFTETIAQLPRCYQPNDAHRPLPGNTDRASHGLPNDAFVMASFNQPFKITPQVWSVWMDILRECSNAVIWQVMANDQARQALWAHAEAAGIARHRIIFAPFLRQGDHLTRLALADVALDPWPCTSHTTASDALWAALPLVSMPGSTFASRVAASLLTTLGRPDWIVDSPQRYKEKILQWAHNPELLAADKASLKQARQTSRLFDGADFAVDLEALYQRMWDQFLSGQPPQALPALANTASLATGQR